MTAQYLRRLLPSVLATVALCATSSVAHAAFDGDYALDNWTLTTGGDGSVSPSSGSASSITLTGNSSPDPGFTDYTVGVTASGTLSFDWTYSSTDLATFDTGGYVLNGARTDLALGFPSAIAMTVSIAVNAGDIFGFYVESFDGIGDPGILTVNNFNAPPAVVPVPAAAWLFGSALGLFGLSSRRRQA